MSMESQSAPPADASAPAAVVVVSTDGVPGEASTPYINVEDR